MSESVPQHVAEMFPAAGVHDRGSADDQDSALPVAGAFHLGGDFANRHALRFFTGDRAVHEAERAVPAGVAADRQHARPVAADDKQVAAFHVRHRHALRGSRNRVDAHPAVHFLPADADPLAVDSNLGVFVGRGIEAVGKRAVHVGFAEPAIDLMQGNDAVLRDGLQDFLQQLRRIGRDQELRITGVGPAMSDLHVLQVE